MTAHLGRFLDALSHVWPLYVAFVLLLGLAYLAARATEAARRHARNPFAPSPQTKAARGELHERAWGK